MNQFGAERKVGREHLRIQGRDSSKFEILFTETLNSRANCQEPDFRLKHWKSRELLLKSSLLDLVMLLSILSQLNAIVELCKAEQWEKGSWDVRRNPNYANCPPVIFSVLWSLHRLCKYRHRISFVHKIEFSSETRGILLEGGSCPRDNTVFKQEKFSFFCK